MVDRIVLERANSIAIMLEDVQPFWLAISMVDSIPKAIGIAATTGSGCRPASLLMMRANTGESAPIVVANATEMLESAATKVMMARHSKTAAS